MGTILMLSAPAGMIRDAARATKRVAGLVVQKVTAWTLRGNLNTKSKNRLSIFLVIA